MRFSLPTHCPSCKQKLTQSPLSFRFYYCSKSIMYHCQIEFNKLNSDQSEVENVEICIDNRRYGWSSSETMCWFYQPDEKRDLLSGTKFRLNLSIRDAWTSLDDFYNFIVNVVEENGLMM